MNFASSYGNSAGSQSFSARVTGHTEDIRSTIAIHVAGVFVDSQSWSNIAALRTWQYSVRQAPGASSIANGIVIQTLGGPGFGTLTIDSYKSWTALLSECTLEKVMLRTGLVFGRLTFILQP